VLGPPESGSHGVVLTGVALPTAPSFPGQTPLVFSPTDYQLNVSDNLPNVRQENLIIDGAGLFRIKFRVDPGASGVFQIVLSGLQMYNGIVELLDLGSDRRHNHGYLSCSWTRRRYSRQRLTACPT